MVVVPFGLYCEVISQMNTTYLEVLTQVIAFIAGEMGQTQTPALFSFHVWFVAEQKKTPAVRARGLLRVLVIGYRGSGKDTWLSPCIRE